jgi:hypothetical protein
MPTVWLSVKDDRKDEICSYCALLLKMFHSLARIEMSSTGGDWKWTVNYRRGVLELLAGENILIVAGNYNLWPWVG